MNSRKRQAQEVESHQFVAHPSDELDDDMGIQTVPIAEGTQGLGGLGAETDVDMGGMGDDESHASVRALGAPMDLGQAEKELEDLRNELKLQYLTNPHLDIKEPDERVQIIDTMTGDQLQLLKLQVQSQTSALVDDGLVKRALDTMSQYIPYVCKTTLQETLQNDELLHGCLKTLLGTTLASVAPKYKFAFLLGSHIIHAAGAANRNSLSSFDQTPASPKRIKATIETPFSLDS